MFLSHKDQWKSLITRLATQKIIGIDTEFEGVDYSSGASVVNLAKIDLWSIAIFDGKFHPRGYKTAKGCVLPPEAIPTLKEILENPDITKYTHNSNAETHSLYNAGVDLAGVVDTLSLARWIKPGRLTYNLDDLCIDYLGTGKTETFKDIFMEDVIEKVNVPKIKHSCIVCHPTPCRKRKPPHDIKVDVTVDDWKEKKTGKRVIPLHQIRDGHPLWQRYYDYAKVDSILALQLGDWLVREGNKVKVHIPWY